MKYPKRKPNRLKGYDYASNGGYFITICTKNKKCLFWEDGPEIQLSPWGVIVDQTIKEIPEHYSGIQLDHYVVMPNHVHLILLIADTSNRGPTISRVINQMKGAATKRIGTPVWQKLYHDRIIRDEAEYLRAWNYIDINPLKWNEDCYYEA